MDNERTAGLERRAAVHAALGDVARLRIVDSLRLGDASPSELSTALGVPSNLLAFHLKTLESAGLVTRHRSEGDGRRLYLHLANEVLHDLDPRPLRAPERVVFVCTANSARSHLAAALWHRTTTIPSASAGTHPASEIDVGAIAVARQHGLRLPRIRPKHVADVAADGDFIVTVCDLAHEELGEKSDVHWSVPDPVRVATTAAFEAAYDDLSARVSDLARQMTVPA